MHWAAKKRAIDPWRDSVRQAWENVTLKNTVKGRPCEVEIHLPFRTKQRRDPHNYTGTNVKAIIDTLVRCGVWPDDTPEWVRVMDPIILIGTTECQVVLTLRAEE